MKNQVFHRRLQYAINGIRLAIETESSFRIQISFAVIAAGLLVVLRPTPVWWGLIILCSAAVLAAELFNTALEALVDQLHPEQNPKIAKVKDCAAGAVLVLSVAALGVGAALIYEILK